MNQLELAHTPGPWLWDSSNYDNRERPFIRCTKNFFGAEKGASICKVSTVLPRIQCEANARLIAAAPELLEALQRCVNYLDTLPERCETTWQLAMSAIEKATQP